MGCRPRYVECFARVRGLTSRLGESTTAFKAVFSNVALRRIQLAWAGSTMGVWAYGIALAIYAFQADGAYAIGLVGMIRWVAAGAAAPLTGVLGDRYPRGRVMLVSDLIRAVAVAAMAVVTAVDGPSILVYAIAVVVTVAATAFRPAQAALLPSLARTPEELTASNVTSSTIEGAAIFIGPALGGLLLAVSSVTVVFLVTVATFLWSAALVYLLPHVPRPRPEKAERTSALAEMGAGIRTLTREPRLALLVGLFAAQTYVDGALGVLVVVLALETLDIGSAGVGLLNSAAGVGGLLGGVVAAALVGRSRLATDFGLGIVLWGIPILVLGLWPNEFVALPLLAIVGVGNTIVDVTGDTLLQRGVEDDVLARVFGLMESLMLVTVAMGAISAPLLVDAFGIRPALVATGALLPVLAILTWGRLRAMDAASAVPARELELLRGLPMFAPLPRATVEQLAGRLQRRAVAAGETIVRQGGPGDRFYVVASGSVRVEVDGEPRPPLGPGDAFGEIALLRDVPRTATVTAETDTELLSLERDEFVSAVTGHPESADAAGLVVRTRLASPGTGHAIG